MKNKIIFGGVILMLAAKSALGAETMNDDADLHQGRGDDYRAHELSVDVFGTGSLGKYSLDHISGSEVRQNTRFGAGVGLNYFFTRNLGISGDLYSEDTSGAFIDSASANLVLRLPLGRSGFSPYAFGGGGYQFDLARVWFAQVGAGMEYRFTRHIGAFLDARWVVPDKTKYFGVARLGLRFSF